MEVLRKKTKYFLQKIIDTVGGKPVDILVLIGYISILLFTSYIIYGIIGVLKNPFNAIRIPTYVYTFFILSPITLFYISMSGEYFKKPSRRVIQYMYISMSAIIITMGYIMQTANTSILLLLGKIKNINVIPITLIEGNIRLISFFFPLVFMIPIGYVTIKLIFDKNFKKIILEYHIEALLKTVYKMDESTMDIKICENIETGEDCTIPEKILNEHVLVQGGSGSGKTATEIKPILGQIFQMKAFYREMLKKMAYYSLENGIARLTMPISNEWLNENFSMDYIVAVDGKEKEFKKIFKKYIIGDRDNGKRIYKGVGVTVISPDGELAKNTIEIADDFNVVVHKIDPSESEIAKGIIKRFNPLIGENPEQVGDIVSSILSSMTQVEGQKASSSYFVEAGIRAVRQLVILLKVMYPRMYKRTPNLNDILKMLNVFNNVVPVVEEMKRDDTLRKRYANVIDYFETSFYPPETDEKGKIIPGRTQGSARSKTEEAIGGMRNQLDNFLGRAEIQYILCPEKDEDSLDYAEILEKGECVAISTRQASLGQVLGKAFALFFILSIQNKVLSRFSENENPEIQHVLVIDEFPFYINDMTKIFFTFARKYKCGLIVAIQNMGQLEEVSKQFRETIFTNTATKILLPKSNYEDIQYWSKFFGTTEEFELQTGISMSSIIADNPSYSENIRGTLKEKPVVREGEIKNMVFQNAFVSYTNAKGLQVTAKGFTDFWKLKEEDKIELKRYDFDKYNPHADRLNNVPLDEEKIYNIANALESEENEQGNSLESEFEININDKIIESESRTNINEGNNNLNNEDELVFAIENKEDNDLYLEGNVEEYKNTTLEIEIEDDVKEKDKNHDDIINNQSLVLKFKEEGENNKENTTNINNTAMLFGEEEIEIEIGDTKD